MHFVSQGGCNFWQDVVLYEKRSLLMPLDRSERGTSERSVKLLGRTADTVAVRVLPRRGSMRGNGRRSHRPSPII